MEKEVLDHEVVEDDLDCEGFLADGNIWSQDVAEALAQANEIGEYKLTDDHWKVIHYVRDFYRNPTNWLDYQNHLDVPNN